MNEIENITRELVCKDFDFGEISSIESLNQQLLEQVIYLLMNDLPKLWNILYRIDVNEKKVKQVFATQNPAEIAPKITQLILERFIEKAETRIRYRNQ